MAGRPNPQFRRMNLTGGPRPETGYNDTSLCLLAYPAGLVTGSSTFNQHTFKS